MHFHTAQLALHVCQTDGELIQNDVRWRRHTAVVQWTEVCGHTLEEAVDAISQSVHVTVMKLIGQTNQRLSRVDCLARDDRDELDTAPPGLLVTVSQSLQLPGVVLAPQCARHPLGFKC